MMEVLAPYHREIPYPAEPHTGTTLLLTDRDDIASAAASLGVEHRYVDPFVQNDDRFVAELQRYDVLVVAWGGGTPEYKLVLRFARACLALLHAACEIGRPMHLVTLSDEANVLSSLLDGMATSAALEASLRHTAVEFDGPVTGERLHAWIAAGARHPGARLRFSEDRVARLEHEPRALDPVASTEVFGPNDTLVLIGGAGGIGRALCRYLSARCGSRVVILGRGAPDRAALAALNDAGAKRYLKVSAHQPDALDEALRYVHDKSGPIRAVFNLAGVLDDCLLPNLTPERLEGVLRPKVAVALALAALSGPHRPELVVHFSSLTSVTGNVGQVAYGAANAFLDRLAPRMPGWSVVNWGLWDTDGMRMPDDASGLRAMEPDRACDVLLSAIAAGVPRLVVFDGRVRLDPTPVPEPVPAPVGRDLRNRTVKWLRELVARHTGLKHMGDQDNLLDAGVDSVVSVRISREVEARLDLGGSARLSRAVVLEHPTIAALADHLVETVGPALEAHLGGAAPAPAAMAEVPAAEDIDRDNGENPGEPGAYRSDDIAIVGMAGEFPNGADVEKFWQSLRRGENAVRIIPANRWDWRAGYSLAADEPDTAYGRHGGFLDHALDFDPVFFGIAPVEAKVMDPQERRFLQTAYHALEDSGYFVDPVHDVGVFVAAMYGHYQDLAAPDRVINSSFAAIANRVSYAFDLHGPSVALDTMCSGGLTALHLAVGAIRSGDCSLALAGGVNIMAHPAKYRLLSEGKFLSRTGFCHAFGVSADGYVPGEGTGTVVLKRLSAAMRDGDRVHAVIRATAVNAGGRTAGFTVPSERAQHRVITAALARAGVEPAAVTYVEAHGTGTQLGDPIEVRALSRAYGGHDQGTAHLGTVKSNIGHLESAAAMAGLVKVVKQLVHRTLVPTLHCELENPYLNLDFSRFTLVKEARPWPKGSGPTRFAGLSSFGAGGANGHAIIQEFVAPDNRPPSPVFARYFIPVSGRDEDAVGRREADLLRALRAEPDLPLYGLSYTLCCAREHFRVRRGYWAGSTAELADLLSGARDAVPSPVDEAWAHAASDYLDGGDPDFARLFPVRWLVDAPLYPFATERYMAGSLTPATPAVASAAQPPATTPAAPTAPDSLLLTPVWRPGGANATAGHLVRCVLAVTDRGREHDLPAPSTGTRLIRVVPGDALSIGADRVELPVEDGAAVARLLNHLTHEVGLDYLHWLDLRREWSVGEVLSFAKALQSCRTPSTVVSVARESDDAEARAMTGFFHGLAEENPHVHAVRIRRSDGRSPFADGWRPLLAELRAAPGSATEVAFVDGTRLVRQLVEVRPGSVPRLRSGSIYLITGGLGAVGRAVAEHLVDQYGATVVVVGRSAPDAARRQWLAAREGLHHERADITSAEQTRDLVGRVCARFGGLDGVIHSAGVVRDALVQNKSAEDAEAVLAPKVAGTRNLDRATADLVLDFFCVFSSISSVLGNVGQSDYIAANRFLDEFAADRARCVERGERSGFTLSVNWPLWLDADDERRERYRALADYLRGQLGLEPLTARRGVRLFADLLDGVPEDCHQVLACVGDVAQVRRRLVDRVAPADVEAPQIVEEPSTALLEEIGGRLIDLVRDQTGLRPADITVDHTWGDLGYNSVMLQRLALSLDSEFGVETPPNALFQYRTIKSLSGYLRDHGVMARELHDTAGSGTAEPDVDQANEADRADHIDLNDCAIIGISGIMPGGHDLTDFWRLLIENRSAIRRVDRWKERDHDYYGGTIDGFDLFDNAFFGLSAREAMLMDPQHRLFLQTSYNALLDAGYAPGALREVGVFAGVQFTEYQAMLPDGDGAHPYAVTGNAHAMLANRVSHLLDFTGPSQTVDTACSSALVALNRGVLSLRAGECEVALVGAVSVLVDPAATDAAGGLGVLSPDHRCATFDKGANGYVRAEGVGCVVVKRLADAHRDGDRVLAVIKAVIENHDGRSNSLTAPNPEAQTALLRRAYTQGLADLVTSIETHGTGTALGDPIEVSALQAVFAELAPHREEGSIVLGAVKTNVGHLEPAAGMAGLLKALLCLEHRILPANINFRELNPLVDLAGSPFRLLLENEDWKADGPLVAGVSSFGFGGSNAHVVLAEAPKPPPVRRAPRPCLLVVLSARSKTSLAAMRDALAQWLRGTDANLADIAYTLDTGRDHFEYRMAWIAADTPDLRVQVEAARPADMARCNRKRLVTNPVVLPDAAGSEYRAALESVRARYLDGEEFDWATVFDGGRYRRLSLPGYTFESNGFWFE